MTGRVDKKFCDDSCRSSFHQRENRGKKLIISQVHKILKKNYDVLCQLNPEDKAKAHKDTLLKNGYDFRYMTNQLVTKTGKTYHFCYNKGILALDNDWYMLVTKFEN